MSFSVQKSVISNQCIIIVIIYSRQFLPLWWLTSCLTEKLILQKTCCFPFEVSCKVAPSVLCAGCSSVTRKGPQMAWIWRILYTIESCPGSFRFYRGLNLSQGTWSTHNPMCMGFSGPFEVGSLYSIRNFIILKVSLRLRRLRHNRWVEVVIQPGTSVSV